MNSQTFHQNIWTMDCCTLEEYLKGRNVPDETIRVLTDSKIDGSVFIKLTRADLSDLLPGHEHFINRKTLWDIIEDQREEMETQGNDTYDDSQVIPPSPPSGRSSMFSTYTKSTSSTSTKISPPSKNREKQFEFNFPISKEMRTCEEKKIFPSKATRSSFIRDCYTCLLATVGSAPRDVHLKEAAKQICLKLTILKDPKPPAWPSDMVFNEWDSVYYSLKKRGYNTNKKQKSSASSSCSIDINESEMNKMCVEIVKELKKKNPSEKAVKEMMTLTFNQRTEKMQSHELQSKEVVPGLVKEFPYLKNELALLIELELHLQENVGSEQMKTGQQLEDNWNNIAMKLMKEEDLDEDDDVSGRALEELHKYFDCSPIIVTCEASEDKDLNELLKKKLKTNSPTLVLNEVDDSENQAFICIDKCVFIECVTDLTFSRCLILLLATYYAFNLHYPPDQMNMFKFLEEFVLKIPPKKRSSKYKRMISKLMNEL